MAQATNPTAPAGAHGPFKIGLLASYSGPYADYGRQFDAGVERYQDENGGRIAGRPLVVLRRDSAGPAPELARRLAQELIVRERIDVLSGIDFSPNAYAIAPLVTQAELPTVIMNASSTAIPSRSPYMARVSFTVPQVSAPMAQWMLEQGLRETFTIVADFTSGVDAEQAFTQVFTAGGGRIVGSLRTPMSHPDFSAYLQRVRDARPEAVFFFFPSGPMPTAFLKAWQSRGLDRSGIRLFATGEATDDSYLEAMGDVALGLVTSHHYSYAHPSTRNQAFVRAVDSAQGGRLRPSYFAVAAYDALNAIGQALAGAPEARGEALMARLSGLRLDSPRGPIEIDARTRDITQTIYIRRTERVDGRLVNTEFDRFERVAGDPLATGPVALARISPPGTSSTTAPAAPVSPPALTPAPTPASR